MNTLASLDLTPNPTLWIAFPLFLLAIAIILYLHRAQKKLMPPRTAAALAAIRITLILLLALLFLQPSLKWIHLRNSSGELWFLIDQSPSMKSTDPQATLAEHIHWAEALGYLSQSARPEKPDLALAQFTAVAAEFPTLRPSTSNISSNTAPESQKITDFSKHLTQWTTQLEAARQSLASDPTASSPIALDALSAIDHLLTAAKSATTAIKSATSLSDASAAVPWSEMQTNLTLAAADLQNLSATSDATFTAAHANDPAITTATARFSNLSRADLANLFATNREKRTSTSIPNLVSNYRVRIATFADNAQTTAAVDPSSFSDALQSALTTPADAHSTNLTAGLQSISEQIAPGQSAAIIILSDGRHNVPGDPTEPARLLATRGVHIFGLLTGSHEVSPDAAVDQIDAPDWIYKGDTLHAAALIRLDGLLSTNGPTLARVELRRNNVVLDTQTLRINSNHDTQRVNFTDKPPDTSSNFEYEVRVQPLPGEVNLQNNRSSFRVAVKKDKLYTLLIDDRPRWEYRYLAAYLSRDQRLKLQTVLLHPASILGISPPTPVKASPDNPQIEAQFLPATREEWSAFDIIILGDIPPDTLTNDQQQFIASAVRDKGATLITIAGQRHMPAQFAHTPLADILPITLTPQWSPEQIDHHTKFGFRPGLAPEGNASVLGQFGLNADTNAALWSDIPLWYWHSPFTQARQSASVIWSIPNDAPPDAAQNPANNTTLTDVHKNALLSILPVGLGRSLYLASDQSWRLRQVYGENVHDRFWGQVLRWAVGSDLPAGGKFVRFGASQPTYIQGQPITITARILREDLTPYTGLNFSANARPANSSTTAVEGRFIESPDSPGYYHATLGGLPPGDNVISLVGPEVERLLAVDPSVTQSTLTLKILPQLDLEQRNMNTDPELLSRVAQAGGGFSLDANYADILASHIPAIQHTEPITEQVGFFTDPSDPGTKIAHWSFLALFTLLLTLEWTLRKRAGLI